LQLTAFQSVELAFHDLERNSDAMKFRLFGLSLLHGKTLNPG